MFLCNFSQNFYHFIATQVMFHLKHRIGKLKIFFKNVKVKSIILSIILKAQAHVRASCPSSDICTAGVAPS